MYDQALHLHFKNMSHHSSRARIYLTKLQLINRFLRVDNGEGSAAKTTMQVLKKKKIRSRKNLPALKSQPLKKLWIILMAIHSHG